MSDKQAVQNGTHLALLPADFPEDEPMEGDWVTCWSCGGEGGEEGDDPFWDWGEWCRCQTCEGQGGWVHEAEKASDAG